MRASLILTRHSADIVIVSVMPLKVLVVDNEPDMVALARMTLEFAGYEVVEAATGPEAIDAVERERPNAVLLDIGLPGMDGWTVLDRLRSAGRLPALKVVVVTAYSGPEVSERTRAAGGVAYISKPFHPTALADAVAEALDGAESQVD